jgi:bacterioferritin (cytochrome b1)
MTVATETQVLDEKDLGVLIQYTVEAYKTFEKLAENLPNPMTAQMFKAFAVDERETRDLLDGKIMANGGTRVRITLAGDLRFQDILEGEMSYRETTEALIGRERSMEKRLRAMVGGASPVDRNLLIYIAATKRAHIVELERELELLKLDGDWFKREDAEWRIIHGSRGNE